MVVAIDTNVLSALLTGTEAHAGNAAITLKSAARKARLVISPPVFAELTAIRGVDQNFIEEFLNSIRVDVSWNMTEAAWCHAAEAYRAHALRRRQSGDPAGPRRILADFLIGAHAVDLNASLLTFDAQHYRSAFPELKIINS